MPATPRPHERPWILPPTITVPWASFARLYLRYMDLPKTEDAFPPAVRPPTASRPLRCPTFLRAIYLAPVLLGFHSASGLHSVISPLLSLPRLRTIRLPPPSLPVHRLAPLPRPLFQLPRPASRPPPHPPQPQLVTRRLKPQLLLRTYRVFRCPRRSQP